MCRKMMSQRMKSAPRYRLLRRKIMERFPASFHCCCNFFRHNHPKRLAAEALAISECEAFPMGNARDAFCGGIVHCAARRRWPRSGPLVDRLPAVRRRKGAPVGECLGLFGCQRSSFKPVARGQAQSNSNSRCAGTGHSFFHLFTTATDAGRRCVHCGSTRATTSVCLINNCRMVLFNWRIATNRFESFNNFNNVDVATTVEDCFISVWATTTTTGFNEFLKLQQQLDRVLHQRVQRNINNCGFIQLQHRTRVQQYFRCNSSHQEYWACQANNSHEVAGGMRCGQLLVDGCKRIWRQLNNEEFREQQRRQVCTTALVLRSL